MLDLLTATESDLQEELKVQEERDRVLSYASADWRVWTLPQLQKLGPFAWPWKRKQGNFRLIHDPSKNFWAEIKHSRLSCC